MGFAKSARLHQNLLDHIAEKILLLNPINLRGDYHLIPYVRLYVSNMVMVLSAPELQTYRRTEFLNLVTMAGW